jgi:hypothetical protein
MLEPSLVDLPFPALESVTSHFYTAVESSDTTASEEKVSLLKHGANDWIA